MVRSRVPHSVSRQARRVSRLARRVSTLRHRLRHFDTARHSDTPALRHSDTARQEPRRSTVKKIPDTGGHCSDTAPTLPRHCSTPRHQCQPTLPRHCPDTGPTLARHWPDTGPTLLDTPTLRHCRAQDPILASGRGGRRLARLGRGAGALGGMGLADVNRSRSGGIWCTPSPAWLGGWGRMQKPI